MRRPDQRAAVAAAGFVSTCCKRRWPSSAPILAPGRSMADRAHTKVGAGQQKLRAADRAGRGVLLGHSSGGRARPPAPEGRTALRPGDEAPGRVRASRPRWSSRSCRPRRPGSTAASRPICTGATACPTTGSSTPTVGPSRPTASLRVRISSSSGPRVPRPWCCNPSPTSPSSPRPSGPDRPRPPGRSWCPDAIGAIAPRLGSADPRLTGYGRALPGTPAVTSRRHVCGSGRYFRDVGTWPRLCSTLDGPASIERRDGRWHATDGRWPGL